MMKLQILLLFVLLGLTAPSVDQQRDPEVLIREINQALSKGNARDLARYFGPNVDMSIPRAEGTFSKQHGEMIFRDFFSRNRVQSFQVTHQGSFEDGSVFVFGRLVTRENQTYRCYYLIKTVSQSTILHHIQLELR